MSCPGNVERLVSIVSKMGRGKLTNDRIIMIAGGTNEEWGQHLRGPRVAALVSAANQKLEALDLQLIAEGIGRERWLPVSVAEFHRARAEQRLRRADAHVRNAHDDMIAIVRDVRAPDSVRVQARAWLELFETDGSAINAVIFDEWAVELRKALPAPTKQSELNTPNRL